MFDYLEAEPIPRNRCHYCGEDFWIAFITKDHIVPRARGGRNVDWNYVPACQPCNSGKGSDLPTCGCRVCQLSLHRHSNLLYSSLGEVGEECPKCGYITMTPQNCPWCA